MLSLRRARSLSISVAAMLDKRIGVCRCVVRCNCRFQRVFPDNQLSKRLAQMLLPIESLVAEATTRLKTKDTCSERTQCPPSERHFRNITRSTTNMTKEQRRRVNEPKFRPEEIAEILGIDRKGVMRLTNKLLMGYYQFGPRTRRIGQGHLEGYLARTRAKARKVSRKRRAELLACGAIAGSAVPLRGSDTRARGSDNL